jgi:hypothetical protein
LLSNKLVFYCYQCKKISHNLSEFLFVEEDSNKSFCSDKCIEGFFSPLVDYYDSEEKKFRSELDLHEKHLVDFLSDDEKIDELLTTPDEIWCQENEFQDKLYTLIKRFKIDHDKSFSLIVLSFMYADKPSFILFMTATEDERVLEKFKVGTKTEMSISKSSSSSSVLEIDAETLTLLESKKSSYLAEMLDKRSPADIPFESFHLYEEYLDPTMQNPDEIFKLKDDEGDEIFTYIKAQVKDTISFYYLVVCYSLKQGPSKDKETLIPILSFPTLDGELYSNYKLGELIQGVVKN